MDKMKGALGYIAAFVFGFVICWMFWPRVVNVTEYQDRTIKGDVQTVTKMELVYVPKNTNVVDGSITRENTDLDISIPKQSLNVIINGRETVIKKADDEQYVFEKNKVQLQQKSTAEINIAVPAVDRTKYWGLGVGYGKNGVAGVLDFPVNKRAGLAGWVYVDRVTGAGGVKVRF